MSNVFISHRGSDSDLAEKLAVDLREDGHSVWLDKWEIKLGDSIVENINKGLEGSTYVILCYSSEGVDSPWMSREWLSSLASQLNGEKIKLLPVMLSKGKVPAILADIKYGDLTIDWDEGVQEILFALR